MDPGEGLRTLKSRDAGFSPGQCVTWGSLPCSYHSIGRWEPTLQGVLSINATIPCPASAVSHQYINVLFRKKEFMLNQTSLRGDDHFQDT